MPMVYHQVAIVTTSNKLFEMISVAANTGKWWNVQTETQEGDERYLEHDPGDGHGIVRLKINRLEADEYIEWECVSNHPEESPASAWTGTKLIFAISSMDTPASLMEQGCTQRASDEIVTLDFYHADYPVNNHYFGFNNFVWACVLQNLKQACEQTS